MAEIIGRLFGMYFLAYPVIYFVYNWFISEIGYIEYQIPGFWVGMAGFLLFNIVKNLIFRRK
jgi:hypothetical protein